MVHKIPMSSKYFLVNQNYIIAGFLWGFFLVLQLQTVKRAGTGQDTDQHSDKIRWSIQVTMNKGSLTYPHPKIHVSEACSLPATHQVWVEVQLAEGICSENIFLHLLHFFSELGKTKPKYTVRLKMIQQHPT